MGTFLKEVGPDLVDLEKERRVWASQLACCEGRVWTIEQRSRWGGAEKNSLGWAGKVEVTSLCSLWNTDLCTYE